MRTRTIDNFDKGLITSIEDYSIKDGASSVSNNWVHKEDKIELRKGYLIYGTEQAGTGKVTGLHTTFKADNTQILYRKRGRKLEYYNTSTSDWTEVGTDIFAAAASDEDVTFGNYASLAGNQMFVGSPNSSIYKIMTANPGSYRNLAPGVIGYFKIKQNRTFLWGTQTDKTGIYGSFIDTAAYISVAAEVLGASGSTTYTGTLAFKAGDNNATCFAVTITGTTGAGVETFTDDYNGVLTGSLGGTGTINYMSGAYSVTFNGLVTSGNVTADYEHENSMSNGIMAFGQSAPRTAGQGFVFRQDDGGGDVKSIESYGDTEYCLHRLKTWALTLTADDTDATNLIYREKVGIPNLRASVATGDGIYYVDDYDQTEPKFRLLQLNTMATQVLPLPISERLNLKDYRFDKAATIEWGEYLLFSCRHESSDENNTVFAYNKSLKAWDKHDYNVSCFAIYNGALVAGDSITENVFELFSGFDDNNSTIGNLWESNLSKQESEDLKKSRKLWVQGEMSRDQTLEIYVSIDRGDYALIGTQNGTDSNVDSASRGLIGSDVIGSGTLGSQTSTTVYNYIKEIRLGIGRYREVKLKFVCTGIGYVSVSSYTFHDIINYPAKLPFRYRTI